MLPRLALVPHQEHLGRRGAAHQQGRRWPRLFAIAACSCRTSLCWQIVRLWALCVGGNMALDALHVRPVPSTRPLSHARTGPPASARRIGALPHVLHTALFHPGPPLHTLKCSH
ncbi:hypothetical protein DL89DRAFT_153959 [Linderina pennispora]|uniref:Uncharacterized protein n=1 Tax=Linderina pennispora TaxID=61395 RepID=A0A1Y1W9K2_9FUNG|nr:uncharacterized protein DL89DRAFT_153959 [Linderina pennispora]ORX70217.1 hypothetical protein DL89DRAFT_153959 [Linderina pennispora]